MALVEQDGVLTSEQANAMFGRTAIRSALACGRWRRLCHGIVVTHNGPLSTRQALWSAVLAAGADATLAGLSAADAAGLRLWRPHRIDLLVPASHRYSSRHGRLPPDVPPVVVHRSRHLPEHHRLATQPPRTVAARSLVDAAGWASSDEQARTVLAAACQQRIVLPARIIEVATELPRARRRDLIIETARDLAGGASALGEIDLVRLCHRFGLPQPELQRRRRDARGRLRYLDAYWPRWRLHLEVDGSHHMDAAHWERDMLRQNDIWIAGDRILRFSAGLVRRHADQVAQQLEAALRAAGWSQ